MWYQDLNKKEFGRRLFTTDGNVENISNFFINDTYLDFSSSANISDSLMDKNNSIGGIDEFQRDFSVPYAILTALALGVIMVGTVIGNIMVIISIFTYKPLRNVQNIFLVSLAASDICVAAVVMPFSVAYQILEKWIFGLHVCKLWLTFDVLCCTASILNLCAIALDRYWAIHDPINYAQKRTLNRVLFMILSVWVISILISVPPLIGWNDWPETFTHDTPCELTQERGYVIYSASGSFFIPLVIMTVVYIRIFQTARNRIRVKAKAAANIMKTDPSVPATKSSTLPLQTISSEVSSLGGKTEVTGLNCNSSSIEMEEKSSAVPESVATENTTDNMNNDSDHKDRPKAAPVVTVKSYMEQKERICLQKERRAARVLGVVMGVFVLSWLPFFMMYVILPFCSSCYISTNAVHFITWLGYLNSALNPIIYTAFNSDFRRSFLGLLGLTRRRK